MEYQKNKRIAQLIAGETLDALDQDERNELENWKQSVYLPMELIGGAFNGNRKIRIRDLIRKKSWHSGEGKNGVDYHKYDVYDPSLIFSWIISQINQENFSGNMHVTSKRQRKKESS